MKMLRNAMQILPWAGWRRVIWLTIGVTIATCLFAVYGTKYARALDGREASQTELIVAVIMSVMVAVPVIGFMAAKLEELRRAYLELDRFAKRDMLTGLFNRGALITMAQQAASELLRDDGVSGCLLVIDIDHFKAVNDTHGHDAGDTALRLIAETLVAHARPGDVVGRLGGEEFAVFLDNCALAEAKVIAERMRHAIAELNFSQDGQRHLLTASIGVSPWMRDAEFTDVNKAADTLLYAAKHAGRNRVVASLSDIKQPRRNRRAVA